MASLTEPVACLTWEIGQDPPEPNAAGRVQVLAKRGGWPVSLTDVSEATGPAEVAAAVHSAVEVLPPRGWRPQAGSDRLISVVVCTLGRDDRLLDTVATLLGQDHQGLEVLVVDNEPATGRTRQLLAGSLDPRLRIVAEPRRGLSYARNTGLAEATHDIVAFTDDDAVPDQDWVGRIAAIFDADGDGVVDCVTGLVLPAVLETEAQLLFEEAGGFGKGLQACHWHREADSEVGALLSSALGSVPGRRGVAFPFDGGFGSGNNMAFRRASLLRLGGFDEALGAGSAALGGEDLDMFQRLFLAGGVIVYWPAALVRHHHRADHTALKAQLRAYGVGMSAVVTKRLLTSPRVAFAVLRRVPAGLRLLLDAGSAKNEHKSGQFPSDLTNAERLGYLIGPFCYLRSVFRIRRALAATQR